MTKYGGDTSTPDLRIQTLDHLPSLFCAAYIITNYITPNPWPPVLCYASGL